MARRGAQGVGPLHQDLQGGLVIAGPCLDHDCQSGESLAIPGGSSGFTDVISLVC